MALSHNFGTSARTPALVPLPYLSSAPKIGLLLRIRTFPRKRSETAPKIGHILYFFAKVKSAATPSANIEFGLIEVDNARVNTIKQR